MAMPSPPKRLNPDQEAMLLMMKLIDRIEVATSFAKIAAGLATVTATRASEQLRVTRVLKIARAAAGAAVHVAKKRVKPQVVDTDVDDPPDTQEAPPSMPAAPH